MSCLHAPAPIRQMISIPFFAPGIAGKVSQLPCQQPQPIRLRGSPMEAYDRLVKLVQDAAEDVQRAEGGNKAAGTRVRKMMQEIKGAAQEVRKGILESRTAESASDTQGGDGGG
jgi:hypothetical protein